MTDSEICILFSKINEEINKTRHAIDLMHTALMGRLRLESERHYEVQQKNQDEIMNVYRSLVPYLGAKIEEIIEIKLNNIYRVPTYEFLEANKEDKGKTE